MTDDQMDERPDRAVSEVDFEETASSAAHEIAGPLGTVVAAVGLLSSRLDPDDTEGRGLVELTERHLRLMELQVQRISRLRRGPDEPDRRPTDLVTLTRELVDDLSISVLSEHPTAVAADGPVEAEIDGDQIRQVVFNLLSNAAKYSPAGRDVVVTITRTEAAVQLRVHDQGHGVVPTESERIFEPYRRGHDATQGVGLGLPVSRAIARAHGGDLQLEPAAEEGGSTFLLTLPHRTAGV